MTTRRRRGRRRLLGVVLGVVLVASGCAASIPTSGPIEQGQLVGVDAEDQFIRVIARPPRAGMTPVELVQGFLEASASFDGNHAVARRVPHAVGRLGVGPGHRGPHLRQPGPGADRAGRGPGARDRGPRPGPSARRGGSRWPLPGRTCRPPSCLPSVDGEWRIAAPAGGPAAVPLGRGPGLPHLRRVLLRPGVLRPGPRPAHDPRHRAGPGHVVGPAAAVRPDDVAGPRGAHGRARRDRAEPGRGAPGRRGGPGRPDLPGPGRGRRDPRGPCPRSWCGRCASCPTSARWRSPWPGSAVRRAGRPLPAAPGLLAQRRPQRPGHDGHGRRGRPGRVVRLVPDGVRPVAGAAGRADAGIVEVPRDSTGSRSPPWTGGAGCGSVPPSRGAAAPASDRDRPGPAAFDRDAIVWTVDRGLRRACRASGRDRGQGARRRPADRPHGAGGVPARDGTRAALVVRTGDPDRPADGAGRAPWLGPAAGDPRAGGVAADRRAGRRLGGRRTHRRARLRRCRSHAGVQRGRGRRLPAGLGAPTKPRSVAAAPDQPLLVGAADGRSTSPRRPCGGPATLATGPAFPG